VLLARVFADTFNWDTILRLGNSFEDHMVAALRIKDRAQREKELERFEADLKKLRAESRDFASWQALAAVLDKEARSKKIGDALVSLLIPAIRKVQQVADRTEQQQRNLHLAFPLPCTRATRGAIP
jgi:hypothetical protein